MADVFPDVSAQAVRFGLPVLRWLVLAVTVLDRLRRQLAALGLGDYGTRSTWSTPATLSEARALGYLALLVVGGVVAIWTYDPAVENAASMVRVVAALDVGSLVSTEVAVMVVFFVAFGVATHALDRLVVGGVRIALAD